MINATRINKDQTVKDKIVIWGASGHTLVVADIIRCRGEFQLVGFLDNVNPQRHHTSLTGWKYWGERNN